MADYFGVLVGTLADNDVVLTDPAEIPPCGGDFMHQNARSMTIFDICSSKRITLHRRIPFANRDETPGEVSGVVMGMSSRADGRIFLVLDTDTAVDVTDPGDWSWEVTYP